MLLTVDYRQSADAVPLIPFDEMQSILEEVLASQGVSRPCYLSLSIVSDEEMAECNASWRGIDAATDVISLECERPDDPDLGEDEPCELGDLMLAPHFIERQANDFSTTPADEMRIMLVHGMLHLLGFDHMEEDEACEMEDVENEILARITTDAEGLNVTFTRHQEDGELA